MNHTFKRLHINRFPLILLSILFLWIASPIAAIAQAKASYAPPKSGAVWQIGCSAACARTGFDGSLGEKMQACDAKNGNILWKNDRAMEFTTLIGIPGKGGSIDYSSPVAWDRMLLINSGYSFFGQTCGNVLMAFEVEQR